MTRFADTIVSTGSAVSTGPRSDGVGDWATVHSLSFFTRQDLSRILIEPQAFENPDAIFPAHQNRAAILRTLIRSAPLLLAIPLYIAYKHLIRASGQNETRPVSVLRERYARGELTDEEFEQ